MDPGSYEQHSQGRIGRWLDRLPPWLALLLVALAGLLAVLYATLDRLP